jgi:4-amino-4-deoxy-L-arabinose transferase-like glycosyltransferase
MTIQPAVAQPTTTHPILHSNLYFVCLLLVIFLLHCATLRPGHVWGDDFAMYIHHAKNIVEQRPYADTGYIYNPAVPVYGPRAYPPVFPLLLAPLYRQFGLNLIPMKVEQTVFLMLTLILVYFFWRVDLGDRYSLALVAILGFSPAFWIAKDEVLSDLPFLLIFYLTAILIRRSQESGTRWWIWAALIGLSLYAAIGTRTAGVALGAGLLFIDVLRNRKITRATAMALAVCTTLLVLQSRFIGPVPNSYLEQLHTITWQTILRNSANYSRALMGFWVGSVQNSFSFLVVAIVGVLIVTGLSGRRLQGLSIIEAFLAPYLVVVLLWPFDAGVRIVYPFIPWMGFLALSGLRVMTRNFSPRFANVLLCGLLLFVGVNYGEAYQKLDFGPIHESAGNPEFSQLCEVIRGHTAASDVFVYYRARALSLYTNRAASTYNYRGTQSELSEYLTKIRASYLVTTSAFDDDKGFLAAFVQNNAPRLDLVYSNADFGLYRVRAEGDSLSSRRENETPVPLFIVK